jgi:hypothetical protein
LSKFIARFQFGANLTTEEAAEWVENFRSLLPEGAVADIRMVPLVVEVENITQEHIGQKVSIFVDKKTGTVEGYLEAVFPSGRQGIAHTLVIDGTAYTVTYGLVTLSEW